MASEWREVSVGEIADLRWGDTNTTKASYVEDGYLAFSASGPDGFLPYADYDRTGVVLSAIGADCGRTWLAQGKWSCIKNTIRFWATDPSVLTEYLYWATRNQNFWPKRGSAQPFISQTDARNVIVAIPTFEEQRAIAETLGALDDRIDNLRQTNATLEAIAAALFKSRLVDFDGEAQEDMQESELGLIPMGWRAGTFGDVLTETSQRVKQRQVVVMSALQTGELVRSDEHFTKRVHSEDISKYKVVPPLSFAYNPSRINIGSIGLNESEDVGAVSPIYVVVEPHSRGHAYLIWHLLRSERINSLIQQLCSGSVRQALTVNNFLSIPIAIPPNETIAEFTSWRDSLYEVVRFNRQQMQALAELRDALLPKLLSGELRVKEAGID